MEYFVWPNSAPVTCWVADHQRIPAVMLLYVFSPFDLVGLTPLPPYLHPLFHQYCQLFVDYIATVLILVESVLRRGLPLSCVSGM